VEEAFLTHLLILVVLLAASAFFSASETAFFSLSFIKLRKLKSRGDRRGDLAARMMVRPRKLIVTILIGNELVNIAASSTIGAYLISLFGPQGTWYAVGIMTLTILIFGEVIPKSLAVSYPEKYALFAAPVLHRFASLTYLPNLIIRRLLRPFLRDSDGGAEDLITEDEFRQMVREGGKAGVLDRGEADIIHNILELEDIPVSSLMVPRTDVFALEEGLAVKEAMERIRARGLSRIPVYREDPDHIVGVLHVKDLLLARARGTLAVSSPVGKFVKKPFITPEKMKADELFMELRNRRTHLAVVVDEYGGTAGIVTMDDLLNQMFEDHSRDISLEKGLYREVSPGIFLLSGKMPMDEFNRLFLTEFEYPEINTIGGVLLHLFGRLPRRGEVLGSGNLRFTVTSVEKHRIAGVKVEILVRGKGS
jgi:putative hemolysin